MQQLGKSLEERLFSMRKPFKISAGEVTHFCVFLFFLKKKFGGLIFLILNLQQFFKITYSERWRDMALRNLDNLPDREIR